MKFEEFTSYLIQKNTMQALIDKLGGDKRQVKNMQFYLAIIKNSINLELTFKATDFFINSNDYKNKTKEYFINAITEAEKRVLKKIKETTINSPEDLFIALIDKKISEFWEF